MSSLGPREAALLQLSALVPGLAVAPRLDTEGTMAGFALWTLPNHAALYSMTVNQNGTVDVIDAGVYRAS